MGQTKPQNPDLLKGTEGTLLGEVLSTTNEEVADFLKKVGSDPTNEDKKVGEVLPLEVALLLVSRQKTEAAEKIEGDFNTEIDQLTESGELEKIHDAEDTTKRDELLQKRDTVHEQVTDLQKTSKLLRRLAWTSIQKRYPAAESLEIRNDGSIVDITAAEGEVCPGCGKVHGKKGHGIGVHVIEVQLG